MWPPRKIPGAAFSVRKMLRYIDSAAMGNCFQAISQLHTEGFLTPTALWAAGVRNGNLPRPKEALNQSPSAEQRIFFPARAASKAGNTYSIPPLLNPSIREKSLAVSSRRLNQRFLKCPPDTFYPASPGRPFDSRTGNHAKIPVRKHRDFFHGDPYGNRTHVTAVKGRCLNRLTNGP